MADTASSSGEDNSFDVTIDDTSPTIVYSPSDDGLDASSSANGWVSCFASASTSLCNPSGESAETNATTLHFTTTDGASIALDWNGECGRQTISERRSLLHSMTEHTTCKPFAPCFLRIAQRSRTIVSQWCAGNGHIFCAAFLTTIKPPKLYFRFSVAHNTTHYSCTNQLPGTAVSLYGLFPVNNPSFPSTLSYSISLDGVPTTNYNSSSTSGNASQDVLASFTNLTNDRHHLQLTMHNPDGLAGPTAQLLFDRAVITSTVPSQYIL